MIRIDATETQTHIARLEAAGWGRPAIAAIAGVGTTTIYRLAWGQQMVHRDTARLILAIEPGTPVHIDEAVVLRVLAGYPVESATNAERREIVARWRGQGRSLKQLADLTGWKPERYYTPGEQVAS